MNYTLTKLDRRHSWHHDFKWMIEFKRPKSWAPHLKSGVLEFDQCRRWFNEKFGWSTDVETRAEIIKESSAAGEYNRHWAYSIQYNEYRLYVADDATLNWFSLTFPQTQHEEPLF
ncbi:hypothetical protein UFOVP328_180 [uncultured Caudovirales phage]|uniref:Uncharacterized protein n=1 Tax=uncultured Caudovirales phage TaxID=2100421 RepID=A0A6J5LY45_9CAUD|nr:hypothetical protein UFOVP328_180 [uncultured Caudovirales phage]